MAPASASTSTSASTGTPRTPLTRATIVDACVELIGDHGIDGLTMRRLGDALGVDATAVYRHFRDKDELLRAVGDHLHDQVLADLPVAGRGRGSWRQVVRELCVRLRASHLRRPDLAALVRTGPPLQDNEFLLTEALLAAFRKAGLTVPAAVAAYHAVIELTVGAAAIDAPMSALPNSHREAAYRSWRQTYAGLDPARFPVSVEVSSRMYPGTADDRFAAALDLLLDGIATKVPGYRR